MHVRRLDATGRLATSGSESWPVINIINSTATPNVSITTLSITDSRQGVTFLIDTGADVSVLSATAHNKRSTQLSTKPTAANGTPIKLHANSVIE